MKTLSPTLKQPKLNPVWFREEDHSYFADEAMTERVPSVSELLKHFGYATDFDAVRRMAGADIVDRAARYGQIAHLTLAMQDKGVLGSYDPLLIPVINGWENYKRFEAIKNDDFYVIETPLYSKVWKYAGTPDRAFLATVPDFKFGADHLSHHIQTALYAILIEENFGVKIKNRLTIHLGDDAGPEKYRVEPHRDRSDDCVAKSLIHIYHDKKAKGLLK